MPLSSVVLTGLLSAILGAGLYFIPRFRKAGVVLVVLGLLVSVSGVCLLQLAWAPGM
jgi:hypothetical protein